MSLNSTTFEHGSVKAEFERVVGSNTEKFSLFVMEIDKQRSIFSAVDDRNYVDDTVKKVYIKIQDWNKVQKGDVIKSLNGISLEKEFEIKSKKPAIARKGKYNFAVIIMESPSPIKVGGSKYFNG